MAMILEAVQAPTIHVIDDALPEPIAVDVYKALHLYGWTFGWLSNHMLEDDFGHWNRAYGGSNKDNRSDISGEIRIPAIAQAWAHIKALMPPATTLIRCYSNAHTYGVEGYVHQDSAHETDLSAILYLNKDWDANDAGELVFLDKYEGGNIMRAVFPNWNRLVIFPGNVPHAARSLSRRCRKARLCLAFKTRTA